MAASLAAAVATGILPVTAVLEAFEPRRLEAFSSFPLLTRCHLHLLVFTTISNLERLLTVKTVQLMFEAQEACHPKDTKVNSATLALKRGCDWSLWHLRFQKLTASGSARQAAVGLLETHWIRQMPLDDKHSAARLCKAPPNDELGLARALICLLRLHA